uniref:Gastrula zinc finger protein XlCGF57.1-like isoform X2 n=1 Tax=Geotrypetes seraphini TaxID=260995 RepID=A0A6P8PZW9_GEOSA|nr:gastrula zinc finger protein XlCGF57.1-like isoform X2 [Geotrypetes seraphini]
MAEPVRAAPGAPPLPPSSEPGTLQSLWLALVRLGGRLQRLEGKIGSLEQRSGAQDGRISANCARLDALENKVRVTFENVALSFSQEGWGYLDGGPKDLYKEAMKENYENLRCLDTDHERINPNLLSSIKQEGNLNGQDPQKSGDGEVTHSYPDHEATLEENREEHPTLLELLPSQSRKVGLKLFQGSEEGEVSQSQQGFEPEQKNPAGDSCYGVTKCDRSDGQLTSIPERQRHLNTERPFQNSNSEQMTFAFCQREGRGKKSFLCDTCGRSFDRKYSLLLHQRTHSGEKPFSCSQCGKSFRQKSSLKFHHRIHTSEKPFPCTQCAKCFCHRESLRIHQKTHIENKPFKCTVCDKSFIYLSHLKGHQKKHLEEKPLKCTECDKSFVYLSHLKTHQRIHTGEKPFECTECNKSFNQLGHLKLHQKIHTGEKPFTCAQCGQNFINQAHLKRHQMVHTGEKPHSCSECNQSFTRVTYLKKHQRIHIDRQRRNKQI